MNTSQVIEVLAAHRNARLHVMLPSGEFVPAHFHVTEIGRVQKSFVDCGGVRRESETCVMQVWTANDVDHRLNAGRLAQIFSIARPVLGEHDLPVGVEYGPEVASQYFVSDIEVTPKGLLFVLVGKQTECLSPDRCGVGSGCCRN
ncbi:DUF6428 family protein [Anatilimnocola floriformis]|uniref:DUF6428 family protein n=1 Tax=Anatilimnocola floriformis TaxID=2948575 RepID=UPI0020C2C74D|nr:DUF6428 family protein [Anatilimnocola floriformis]